MISGQEPGRCAVRFQIMATQPFLRSSARYVGLYALAEIAALTLLIWALGLGWTLLVLAATFAVGVLLAASQIRGQFLAAPRARNAPQTAMADGMLVGLGSFLVLLPGVVTTAAGALILAPPTRGAMRPLAATMLTRGVARRMASLNVYFDINQNQDTGTRVGRGDYIDGEVIGEVVDQLPVRR